LARQKNLFQWLDIARLVHESLPEARFTLVGDGELRAALEAHAGQLNLQHVVTFTGFQPYSKLAEYYRRASVFLLVSHYEGFGRVVVEAALHHLPTVSIRMTGVEDIIRHEETGLLHDTYDTDAIAASLVRLLTNPERVRRMGETAHAHMNRTFAAEQLMEAWVDLVIQATQTTSL
jgi:glycosyltransferase involved in cell wall biosynthesis